ncbi:MAG: protein kinase [Ectothiorhodospiraceae bacterium]|nr:protein kinase [Chromatiales bacterium]MCP5157392.1 protein kinase [Ectothiorhodospiraceae bacterium]
MNDIPRKLGKYEVEDVIGRGSMGIVLRGLDPFADRRVAIKLCRPFGPDRREARRARKLFFNEAHAAGGLDHPNIVRVLDAGEDEGRAYIVMELIAEATTLEPHVRAEGLLTPARAVEIVYHVARALDHAHRHGVVHRDVKPSNILVTSTGDTKIGDFGIAHHVGSDTTQVMGLMGSPRYMSPEQVDDVRVDQRTDVYSLGVVLYELLTGSPPFAARSFSALMRKILTETPRPPRELRPELPPALDAVVGRALAKSPDDRYPSAGAMAAELALVYRNLHATRPSQSVEERTELMGRLAFFAEFDAAELREVVGASTWRQCEAGERIIAEGALEDSFYILVSGEVAVLKDGVAIAHLARGDCFGEMGYLSRTRRSASIEALDRVQVLQIDAAQVAVTSLRCQLRFNQAFIRTLVDRLSRTSEALARQGGEAARRA